MIKNFEQYKRQQEEQGEHFELVRRGTNAEHILQFLMANPNRGFTPSEIGEETGVAKGSVGTTLTRLRDRGLVKHAEPYWALGDDDRLASWGAQFTSLRAVNDRFGEEDIEPWLEAADRYEEEQDRG